MHVMFIFGGRHYAPPGSLDNIESHRALDNIYRGFFENRNEQQLMIVTGGATGADALGLEWSVRREIMAMRVPARWESEGNRAGPRRNMRMLNIIQDLAYGMDRRGLLLCVQFPGGPGTSHMERLCRDRMLVHKDMQLVNGRDFI